MSGQDSPCHAGGVDRAVGWSLTDLALVCQACLQQQGWGKDQLDVLLPMGFGKHGLQRLEERHDAIQREGGRAGCFVQLQGL